jgi:ATP phosphoribosyltransferase regulatory subunit HisZ
MPTEPFETELRTLAEEIGLTPQQHRAVARWIRRQMDETMDAAIELAAEEPDNTEGRH